MGAASAVLVVLITILFPPVGVAIVAGCGADLFINIALTILGYIPGHIHAFYIEYVYYDRQEQARQGRLAARRAPGVYSEAVQTGGYGYNALRQPAY
ncbi:putative stress response RCI peptide [Xylaria palmicola]|nr:putative stress response RCI peptide [Xylaria palmicola]